MNCIIGSPFYDRLYLLFACTFNLAMAQYIRIAAWYAQRSWVPHSSSHHNVDGDYCSRAARLQRLALWQQRLHKEDVIREYHGKLRIHNAYVSIMISIFLNFYLCNIAMDFSVPDHIFDSQKYSLISSLTSNQEPRKGV